MSTPRIEHIALNIKSAIDLITTANGFNQDLTAVRPKRNDWKDEPAEDNKVLIWQLDEKEPEAEGMGSQQWIQPFSLIAYVIDSDTASASIDTRINQVRADIQKKLCEDVTRGGYAFDTAILPCAKFVDGEGFSGIEVIIEVHYRTEEDDPYTGI